LGGNRRLCKDKRSDCCDSEESEVTGPIINSLGPETTTKKKIEPPYQKTYPDLGAKILSEEHSKVHRPPCETVFAQLGKKRSSPVNRDLMTEVEDWQILSHATRANRSSTRGTHKEKKTDSFLEKYWLWHVINPVLTRYESAANRKAGMANQQ